MSEPFASLPKGHFKAIYADPPWSFRVWNSDTGSGRSAESHYSTMSMDDLAALPGLGFDPVLESLEMKTPVGREYRVVRYRGTFSDLEDHIVITPHRLRQKNHIPRIDPNIGKNADPVSNAAGDDRKADRMPLQ